MANLFALTKNNQDVDSALKAATLFLRGASELPENKKAFEQIVEAIRSGFPLYTDKSFSHKGSKTENVLYTHIMLLRLLRGVEMWPEMRPFELIFDTYETCLKQVPDPAKENFFKAVIDKTDKLHFNNTRRVSAFMLGLVTMWAEHDEETFKNITDKYDNHIFAYTGVDSESAKTVQDKLMKLCGRKEGPYFRAVANKFFKTALLAKLCIPHERLIKAQRVVEETSRELDEKGFFDGSEATNGIAGLSAKQRQEQKLWGDTKPSQHKLG